MEIGQKAPEFALKDKNGTVHTLASIAGEHTVVYFYPKDDTPGCTIETRELDEALPQFEQLKTSVVGISGGNERSKTKFCNKYDLSILLLSDTGFETAKAFDSYGEKRFMGRTFQGIHRRTFILGPKLEIVRIFEQVKPEGHAAQLLAALKELKQDEGAAGRA